LEVAIRGASEVEISLKRTGFVTEPVLRLSGTPRDFSSANEFQLPHSGQRPSHFAET
jgi:hypothetical protein